MRKKSLSCANIRRKFDVKNMVSGTPATTTTETRENTVTGNSSKSRFGGGDVGKIFICTRLISDEDDLPLLLFDNNKNSPRNKKAQRAGSLSSFNSSLTTPATEVSFLMESSSTEETINKTNKESKSDDESQKLVRLRHPRRRATTTGKIRCLKHRPHSLSLSERSLPRLQQQQQNILNETDVDNVVSQSSEQRGNEAEMLVNTLSCDDDDNIDKENLPTNLTPPHKEKCSCGAGSSAAVGGMTRKQRRSLRTANNNNTHDNNSDLKDASLTELQNNKSLDHSADSITTDCLNDSTENNNAKDNDDLNNNCNICSCGGSGNADERQISFSKEQRRRLKQRMRERQRFQDKSIFLGLF